MQLRSGNSLCWIGATYLMLWPTSVLAEPLIDPICSHALRHEGKLQQGSNTTLFRIADDEQAYKLEGIRVLKRLDLSSNAQIFVSDDEPADRYGRKPAQVIYEGKWLQQSLLEDGRALVFGNTGLNDCYRILLGFEAVARSSLKGVWQKAQFGLKARHPKRMLEYDGKLIVASGKVLSVGDRSRRLYLNFGKNWSQDFTVSVVKSGKGAFKGGNLVDLADLQSLAGREVLVRGMLENRKGPLIRLYHGSQIQIME